MNLASLYTIAISALLANACSTAQAHVVIENFEGRANYNEFLTLMVPHGCGNLDTTEVMMKIPPSVPLFAPENKDGWETALVMRTLDEPVKRGNGPVITEVYDEVVWRGHLPANQLGVFKFLARMPGKVGTVVPFKTIQICGDQQDRWVDVVEDGEPAWKMWAYEKPAPYVTVVDGGGPQLGASMKDIGAERQRLSQGANRE
jgi:uncharacterized protein YcnI